MVASDIEQCVVFVVVFGILTSGFIIDYFTKERQKKNFSIEVYDPESESIYLSLHFHEKICPSVKIERYMSLELLEVTIGTECYTFSMQNRQMPQVRVLEINKK